MSEDATLSVQAKLRQPGHVQKEQDVSEVSKAALTFDTFSWWFCIVTVCLSLWSDQADPTSNLTFNLRLSEEERKAKEKVALPFVFSQEK